MEVSGVGLGDLYRDHDGVLWEVIALITDPQAVVQRVCDGERKQEAHVIDCLNWRSMWACRYDERKP